jgi:hypothetical protein
MGRVELYPFRFRDPVTGRWVRARYRAQRDEIERRYVEYEIVGPPEVRDGDPDAPRFTPHGERGTDVAAPDAAAPEFQPHLAKPPAVDPTEIGLLQVFLRRYVTYCARRRRYASMNGAVRLFADLNDTLAAGRRG